MKKYIKSTHLEDNPTHLSQVGFDFYHGDDYDYDYNRVMRAIEIAINRSGVEFDAADIYSIDYAQYPKGTVAGVSVDFWHDGNYDTQLIERNIEKYITRAIDDLDAEVLGFDFRSLD